LISREFTLIPAMPENDLLKSITFQSAIDDVEMYGLIMLDPEGRVVTWNRGATHLLGFSETEALGLHFEFIFTPEDRAKKIPQQEVSKAALHGYAYDDRWHVRKDQSQIYVNGGLCLLKSDDGKPLGFVKIIRDQTERKEHLEKIEELNGMLLQAHKVMGDHAADLEEKVQARTQELKERNAELQDFCYPMPRLILLDLKLPLKSGLEVLQWIREQPLVKRIPVIVFSSSLDRSDVNGAYDLGANGYFLKTGSLETMRKLVILWRDCWLTNSVAPDLIK
jgi:PAS domain S-box-containing protein